MINNMDFEKAQTVGHFERTCFLDAGQPVARLEEQQSPRLMTSHLPVQFLPDNLNKRVKV
jgi:hypothetical protein